MTDGIGNLFEGIASGYQQGDQANLERQKFKAAKEQNVAENAFRDKTLQNQQDMFRIQQDANRVAQDRQYALELQMQDFRNQQLQFEKDKNASDDIYKQSEARRNDALTKQLMQSIADQKELHQYVMQKAANEADLSGAAVDQAELSNRAARNKLNLEEQFGPQNAASEASINASKAKAAEIEAKLAEKRVPYVLASLPLDALDKQLEVAAKARSLAEEWSGMKDRKLLAESALKQRWELSRVAVERGLTPEAAGNWMAANTIAAKDLDDALKGGIFNDPNSPTYKTFANMLKTARDEMLNNGDVRPNAIAIGAIYDLLDKYNGGKAPAESKPSSRPSQGPGSEFASPLDKLYGAAPVQSIPDSYQYKGSSEGHLGNLVLANTLDDSASTDMFTKFVQKVGNTYGLDVPHAEARAKDLFLRAVEQDYKLRPEGAMERFPLDIFGAPALGSRGRTVLKNMLDNPAKYLPPKAAAKK